MTEQLNTTILQVPEIPDEGNKLEEKIILIDMDSYIDLYSYKHLLIGLRKIYGSVQIHAFISGSKTISNENRLETFEKLCKKLNIRVSRVFSVLDKIKSHITRENAQKFYIVSENAEYIENLIRSYPPSLIEFVNAHKGTTIVRYAIKDRNIPFLGIPAARPRNPEDTKDKYIFNKLFIPKQKVVKLVKILKKFEFTIKDAMTMESISTNSIKTKYILKKLPVTIDKLKRMISKKLQDPSKVNAFILALILHHDLKVEIQNENCIISKKTAKPAAKKGDKPDEQ